MFEKFAVLYFSVIWVVTPMSNNKDHLVGQLTSPGTQLEIRLIVPYSGSKLASRVARISEGVGRVVNKLMFFTAMAWPAHPPHPTCDNF